MYETRNLSSDTRVDYAELEVKIAGCDGAYDDILILESCDERRRTEV